MSFFSNLKCKLKLSTILITIIISLFLIVVILEIIQNISNNVEEKVIADSNPNQIFYSIDNDISIELAKKYELKKYNSSKNYILELRSTTNLDVFISKKELLNDKSFIDIVSADKRAYLDEFEATTNISNPTEIDVFNNDSAYTYSFQYLDTNTKKAYYLQIIWIETEKGYYIIDIEFPVEYINLYSSIITDIVSGLKY